MASRLEVRTDDPDALIARLPDVALTGTVVEREDDGHGWVRINPAMPEDVPESLWFELSWHADKLGISQGRTVEVEDADG
jgi:hypothetical protein